MSCQVVVCCSSHPDHRCESITSVYITSVYITSVYITSFRRSSIPSLDRHASEGGDVGEKEAHLARPSTPAGIRDIAAGLVSLRPM
jgi:hypothetical protein